MYVKVILDQLLVGSTDVLPDIWKQSHPEAVRTYRTEERRDQTDRQRGRRRLLENAKRKNE